MAEHMMRVAGRGSDGTAKALSTNAWGHLDATIKESKLQYRIDITNELTLPAAGQSIIIINRLIKENVTAWALYGFEINRPTTDITNHKTLKIKVEYSNSEDGFGNEQGKPVFSRVFEFSDIDEFDKGLAIPKDSTSTHGTNLILASKFFNIPMAKYLRVTLINDNPNSNFRFHPFALVEEGSFR